VSLEEIKFTSANGRDQINGWLYAPAKPPVAVVQIIHGLGEHSRRYIHMISRFLDAGFVVIADDHAGHGATAKASGVWMDTGEDGKRVVVADELTLRDIASKKYPALPYFVYGHSWGSMIARAMASEVSDELSGVILCGIAAQIRGIDHDLDRGALQKEIEKSGPLADGSAFLGTLFGGFTDRYDNPNGPSDWIANDPNVVQDHASDSFNALDAPMSLRFVKDFADLYDDVNADCWAETVKKDLPVFIIAGDLDPVANYGEGAYHVANQLWNAGRRKVETKVYPGHRHEIHNEPDSREEVENDIIAFVSSNS